MSKKGKYDELKEKNAKVDYYNKIWSEAMAESSYDATDYKITGYDEKALKKEKNKEAMRYFYGLEDFSHKRKLMKRLEKK